MSFLRSTKPRTRDRYFIFLPFSSIFLLTLTFIGFLLMSLNSVAESYWPETRSRTRWFTSISQSRVSYSDLNSQNILEIPHQYLKSQIREDLRIQFPLFSFTLRPRFSFEHSRRLEGYLLEDDHTSKTKLDWSEVFAQWDISDSLFVVYGIQNFQWGPAESFSASNGIFKETVQQKTLNYDLRGKHILRINQSWTPQINTVLLLELSDYGQDEKFLADIPFRQKFLQKTEVTWNRGADYFGGIIGGDERLPPYIGEYLNISLSEGLSFYLDARHQKGSQSWYPTQESNLSPILLQQTKKSSSEILSLGSLGLRYAFIQGSDFRYEWIHFDPGYSPNDHKLLQDGLLSTHVNQLLATSSWNHRLKGLGLEFPGRNFSYFSLRTPDINNLANWNFSGRALLSHSDQSIQYYLSTDWAAGNAGTCTLALLFAPNNQKSELGTPAHSTYYFGYEHVW